MNEKIKNIIKNPKFLIILGIGGILLIFLSSIIPSSDKKSDTEVKSEYTAEEYRLSLQEDIKNIVIGISHDKNPTVVVTLESGIRYKYASADETDSSNSSGNTTDQSSESKKQSYITIRNSDGGEQALIVTEIMPEIRGVAIICEGGGNEKTAEKIKNAVTAALNIISKRVYISGGIGQ